MLFRNKQVIENRKRLTCIIECIMLCGRQELPLRGHRDFGSISFDGMNFNKYDFISASYISICLYKKHLL